jgi:hypothetical protein
MKNVANQSFKNRVFTPTRVLGETYIDCDFKMSTMNGVHLVGRFVNCNFINAEFRHAHLMEAQFINCNFIGTKFKQATIRGCTFDLCDFGGASLYKIAGISTSTFRMNCKGIMGMSSDLAIKLLPALQIYSIIPRHMTTTVFKPTPPNFFSTTPSATQPKLTAGTSSAGPGVARIVEGPPLRIAVLPVHTGLAKLTPTVITPKVITPKVNRLVDPESLPDVEHYRSPPSQILESDKPKKKEKYVSCMEEEDYYACAAGGYTMAGHGQSHRSRGGYGNAYGGGAWRTVTYNEKYRFGYMSNGVLECSDIEELRACQS